VAKKSLNDRGVTRRRFLRDGTTLGVGATALAGVATQDAAVEAQRPARWDRTADVVVIGAGASGLCAAIMARDQGASVLVVEQNHDIGGHAMLSGGRIPLGGGHSLQKKYGITDSIEQVYLDHTAPGNLGFRYSDRDLVRVWADENVATMEFLLQNGVQFVDTKPTIVNGGTVPRLFRTTVFSPDLKQTINGNFGSGLVRPLEKSARAKGVEFLVSHTLTRIIRETPASGPVQGVTATSQGKPVNIQARKGVIIATGGHTSNVEFRRIFDPRLTEEYQVAGEPWTKQTADGELLAMAIGASLWATGNQTGERGSPITKTAHIGCRYGYDNLRWKPESPMFAAAGASGLTVENFQNVILVNQVGQRFWNEMDESFAFLTACLSRHGSGNGRKTQNGGGPIWAIFDADAVTREKWDPTPPNVDPKGWFFAADTIAELAGRIANPYQPQPISGRVLEETVARYNSFVDAGKDADFNKPAPMFKIQKPPFYAAWSTPILHDTLTGLRITTKCQVLDLRGQTIAGLYCAGESAGGFALHGLPRVTVFGRIAGREAARATT
jgi:succinate dehydrogenase/fumarate reductase flavoprotein subunit